ncbi:MAG: ATP-binding protein [Candidatus Magasanikbacteria bacterium]|jgi:hypothetical protein
MSNVFFSRKIYGQIKEHVLAKQITVLTGMRRVGKTTMVKQLLSEIVSKNKIYLDLQQINNRELFSEKNFDNIITRLSQLGLSLDEKMFIAIDEIQLFPEISGVLKYLYDSYDIKFIVTGSSSYYLKDLFSESLAGRKRVFELFPLDFGEYLTFKNIVWANADFLGKQFDVYEFERLRIFYEDYVEYGGFPEVVLATKSEDKKSILNDIISSYVNIDIKTLSDFRESSNVYNLIKMLAARVGTRLDYAKLSRHSGIARTTVSNYVSLFEKTYLISLVPVHTNDTDREIVKAKKVYFADNGLVNILADVDSGSKFENAVYNQLRHKGEVRYFALKNGREIDFIFDEKIAMEAKETPTESDAIALEGLTQLTKVKKCRLIGRHHSPRYSDYIWAGDIK